MRRFPLSVLALSILSIAALPFAGWADPPPAVVEEQGDEVPGLIAPVRVFRDTHDIPHIFARNDRDALYALGQAHARDRFFQMDVLRRQFSGTLAELVGPPGLETDVQLRTLGLRRAAEASLAVLSRETRVWLNAYARGVNDYIYDTANPMPPEYAALELTRSSLEPWTPVDSLVIAKGLAFGLSFDLSDIDLTVALGAFQQAGQAAGFNGTLLFSQDTYRAAPFDPAVSIPGWLRGRTVSTIAGIRPEASGPKSATVPEYLTERTLDLARRYRDQARRVPLLRDALERRAAGNGSNWWVAGGSVTESGNPILANDPHLQLSVPSIFYEAQLRVSGGAGPAMNAFGVTFPGIAGIVLGCNTRVCWGATTNPMDVTDVYQERLVIDPVLGLPTHTLFDGRREPLVVIPQTFSVNRTGNGTMDDLADAGLGPLEGGITLVVPRRNNGPIVSVDLSDPANATAISVQYTGWSATRELDTFRMWHRTADLDDFRAALQLFDVGSQNWSYADVDGNIAYFTSAEMPLREDLQLLERPDGGIPPYLIRDGSHTLRHEWLPLRGRQPGQAIPFEILPFEEMPQEVNPERGWIANANNDPVGTSNDNDPLNQRRRAGGLFYLGIAYDRGYRIGRIERLLEAELARDGSFSVEDFERMQANHQMLDAEVLVPHILNAYHRATRPAADGQLRDLVSDIRVQQAVERFRNWDFSTPTGIREGYDPGDDPTALPEPSAEEIANSVAATLYSVWRGQVLEKTIDRTLSRVGLGDFVPPGDVALADLRHLLESFGRTKGVGASGLQFFNAPGFSAPADARDFIILESLLHALYILSGDSFAPAFNRSLDLNDYRWGRLHRLVLDHPLGGPFDIPPGGGLSHLGPHLPGIARSGGFGVVDASNHDPRASSYDDFMFGSGPARRFIGEMTRRGPEAEEVIPGGESGIPGSPFQTDQLRLWLTNRYHPWLWRPADVAGASR
ncbi:MAG TPA: penicillin acylase family protein [Thermoanaerobaculia bacterium]|nr:penicillin acylase family protein [Thermoanaerobaculia bacterium]